MSKKVDRSPLFCFHDSHMLTLLIIISYLHSAMLHPVSIPTYKNVSVLNGPVWSLAILTFLALSGNLSFTSIRESTRKAPRKWHLRAQDGAAVDAAPLWQNLLEGKDYVNLVQIGACDGDFGSTSSNDPVQHFMMNEPKIRALLVEASPSTYETLRRKVADLHEDRLRTVNAAVAPFLQEKVPEVVVRKVDRFQHHHHHHHPLLGSLAGLPTWVPKLLIFTPPSTCLFSRIWDFGITNQVPFYVVSKHFQEDYPRKAFHWAMWQLNSMDRDHVLKHHVHLGLTEEEAGLFGQLVGSWVTSVGTVPRG